MELKNAWVVRHDGLLFGSGWYVDADELTKYLVDSAVRLFRLVGLEQTVAAFNSPDHLISGLTSTIEYYNNSPNLEGEWVALAADENGIVVASYDPAFLGRDLWDVLGTEEVAGRRNGRSTTARGVTVTGNGRWITTSSARVWAAGHDWYVFAAGWRRS